MPDRIAVFVDESGQPSRSGKSSGHFAMGAMMVRQSRMSEVDDWLLATKRLIGRQPHHELHWNKIRVPSQRESVSDALGAQTWGRFTSVVVCKSRLVGTRAMTDDESYLYTLRYLCERLSWFGRSLGMPIDLTIAHKIRFRRSSLEEYGRRLRMLPDCEIDWRYLDLASAELDQPKRCAPLQVADCFVSAVGGAFEPDRHGVVHPDYVRRFAPRLYRGSLGSKPLTYGMKIHPFAGAVRDHAWLANV